MNKSRHPLLKFVRSVLGHHFAALEPLLVLFAVVLLVSFHWFAAETYHWVSTAVKPLGWPDWMRHVLILVPFIILILLVLGLARIAKGGELSIQRVLQAANRYDALLLFLSPPGRDESDIETLAGAGSLLDEEVRKRFKGPWRMPAEAIFQQIDKLRFILIVPSADTSSATKGTIHNYDDFRKVFEPLLAATGKSAQIELLAGYRWERGVNFEDGDLVADAVDDAIHQLNHQGVKTSDILVDVTGGYGLVSVIGAAVAIDHGCRIGWVNRNDYQTQVYSISFVPDTAQ
ncbi:MAG: hypothetical protein IT166_15820 [Bryobacterales bacterium]|nr:hypothetical protein [Bryobacterales bacterium]